ncbi:hypothetical protein [Mycobacterium sp. URHB0021]
MTTLPGNKPAVGIPMPGRAISEAITTAHTTVAIHWRQSVPIRRGFVEIIVAATVEVELLVDVAVTAGGDLIVVAAALFAGDRSRLDAGINRFVDIRSRLLRLTVLREGFSDKPLGLLRRQPGSSRLARNGFGVDFDLRFTGGVACEAEPLVGIAVAVENDLRIRAGLAILCEGVLYQSLGLLG